MKNYTLENLLTQAWSAIQANQPNRSLRTIIEQQVQQNTVPEYYQCNLYYYLGILYNLEGASQKTLKYLGMAVQAPVVNRQLSCEVAQKYILLLEQFALIERAISELEGFASFFEEAWFTEQRTRLMQIVEEQKYPPKSNVENWKNLQKNGYFDNHVHYKMPEGLKWQGIDLNIIEKYMTLKPDTTVAIIGSGYGRESALFSPRVAQIYGIDVDLGILQRSVQELTLKGVTNFIPVVFDDWKEQVPNDIDLVYCFTVFQHLTKYLVRDYLENFYSKLAPGGHFICQFMGSPQTGSYDAMCVDYEPHVSWTPKEIESTFAQVGLKLKHFDQVLHNKEEGVYWYWVHAQKPD